MGVVVVAEHAIGAQAWPRHGVQQLQHVVGPAVIVDKISRMDEQIVLQAGGQATDAVDLGLFACAAFSSLEMGIAQVQNAQPWLGQPPCRVGQVYLQPLQLDRQGFHPEGIGQQRASHPGRSCQPGEAAATRNGPLHGTPIFRKKRGVRYTSIFEHGVQDSRA